MTDLIQKLAAGGAPRDIQSIFNQLVAQGANPQQLLALAQRLHVPLPPTPIRQMRGGEYLRGPGDGMSDEIVAHINGRTPAALSDGEFVISADVVSGLGNGSSDAGAKLLYEMMDRVRHARTGTTKQGKEIKGRKYLPA